MLEGSWMLSWNKFVYHLIWRNKREFIYKRVRNRTADGAASWKWRGQLLFCKPDVLFRVKIPCDCSGHTRTWQIAARPGGIYTGTFCRRSERISRPPGTQAHHFAGIQWWRQHCADFCLEISGICGSADFKWSESESVWHEAVRAGGCGAGVPGRWGETLAAEERHRAGKRKNADGSRENADRKAVFKRKRKKEWTGRTE